MGCLNIIHENAKNKCETAFVKKYRSPGQPCFAASGKSTAPIMRGNEFLPEHVGYALLRVTIICETRTTRTCPLSC